MLAVNLGVLGQGIHSLLMCVAQQDVSLSIAHAVPRVACHVLQLERYSLCAKQKIVFSRGLGGRGYCVFA